MFWTYQDKDYVWISWHLSALIARLMGPTWGPSVADRTQVGPMLAPWTLPSGWLMTPTDVSGDRHDIFQGITETLLCLIGRACYHHTAERKFLLIFCLYSCFVYIKYFLLFSSQIILTLKCSIGTMIASLYQYYYCIFTKSNYTPQKHIG